MGKCAPLRNVLRFLIVWSVVTGLTGCRIEVDPVMPWHRNEATARQILAELTPQKDGRCVVSVGTRAGMTLLPEAPVNANGYVFILHVSGSSFRVDAGASAQGRNRRLVILPDRRWHHSLFRRRARFQSKGTNDQ